MEPTNPTNPNTPGINWSPIEEDWVAGVKNLSLMSREYGVSRAGIIKHCEKLGLERSLAPKIRAEAEKRLQREAVAAELQESEEDIVQANAERQVGIRKRQRSRLDRMDEACDILLANLLELGLERVKLEQLILAVGQNDDTQHLVERLEKLASSERQVAILEKLSYVAKNVTQLENDTWGLTAKGNQTVLPANVWIDISGS